jgi:dTDP-4-dehydrorhamnose reductase
VSRLLVIGASGQVGHHLMRAAGSDAVGTYHQRAVEGMRALDVRDADAVLDVIEDERPEWVLLPASATNVDRCESEPGPAYEVNVRGVANVVRAATRVGARVAYFSSDYVFDGEDGPYDEDEPPRPIMEYGRQKVFAEHAVLQSAPDALILRTTVVYGWEPQGKNFVYRMLGHLERGEPIRVPADQIGSPTYAPGLARATLALVERGEAGVWNLVGDALADRATFARAVAEAFGGDPDLVVGVSTAELGQAAPRPLRLGLRIDRARPLVGADLPGYPDGLRLMADERRAAQEAPADA